jgi:protein-tyrosine phosphatase
MNPPAAAELRRRGVDPSGFSARHLTGELIDESDLVLCATREQVDRVFSLRPASRGRTFVLGEFGRLHRLVGRPSVVGVATGALAGMPPDPASVHARGVALAAAVDAHRAGSPSRPGDDLDDPWGLPAREFTRVADEIAATVVPLAAALCLRG